MMKKSHQQECPPKGFCLGNLRESTKIETMEVEPQGNHEQDEAESKIHDVVADGEQKECENDDEDADADEKHVLEMMMTMELNHSQRLSISQKSMFESHLSCAILQRRR